MDQRLRKQIIERLEILRGRGQFDDSVEGTMDFNNCSDEELKFYSAEELQYDSDEELQYHKDHLRTEQFDDEDSRQITTTSIEGYFTESQAKKLKEKMQGKSYLNFSVEYSNENGNCTLIVSTDYYEENEFNTKEEFEQVLHGDFMYFALLEMM